VWVIFLIVGLVLICCLLASGLFYARFVYKREGKSGKWVKVPPGRIGIRKAGHAVVATMRMAKAQERAQVAPPTTTTTTTATDGGDEGGAVSDSEPSEGGATITPMRTVTLIMKTAAKLRHPSRLVRARKANELRQKLQGQASGGSNGESSLATPPAVAPEADEPAQLAGEAEGSAEACAAEGGTSESGVSFSHLTRI